MSHRHGVCSWLTAIISFFMFAPNVFSDPLEPQAAFTLNRSGWVEVALRQEGRPVANATIQIIDDQGGNFAEGETGEEGETAFPLPRGDFCVVEIKIGKRTADPIRLYKFDKRIEPARVLLSYGLRPCCRFKDRGEVETVETALESPDVPIESYGMWSILAAVGAGFSIAVLIFFMAKGRFASASGSAWRK